MVVPQSVNTTALAGQGGWIPTYLMKPERLKQMEADETFALCLQNCMIVPNVNQADGSAVSVQLQARGNGVPADNMLSAVATYATVSGEPCTASLQASLSL